MKSEPPYIPTVCRTEVTPEGRFVRVVYEHAERENREFLIPTQQFQTFAKVLQQQSDQLAPKRPSRTFLGPGQSLAVDGFRLDDHPDGELVLHVLARLFDQDGERGLTIPIPLSPMAAENLRLSLERKLSSDEKE